ncbi:MAG: peptidylprolyl isomerase [Cytophagales bacterium]|nr:MAG: peptidylprolyl isomerase [Cytophagales bacterium]
MISLRSSIAISLMLSVALACKTTQKQPTSQSSATSVIETIAGKPVTVNEFKYVYNKNNSSAKDAYTKESINEYLDLFTNFKLKVKEAEALGLDSAESFKSELNGYKKQLAQPYLTEKSATDILAKEAYERMKEEVSAAHILLTIAPDASSEDTLKVYNQINDIRNKALAGSNFEELAVQYSQDPSAKSNKGNLGYFSALQMVYPFENAAYNTKAGGISNIIRTRFGYHILKVFNRRASQGQVLTAHIMIRATEGMPLSDSLAAKQKIDEIYSRLKKGDSWNLLAEQFSEDVNSKSKGGELPWFTTGRMIPSFEEAAYALKNKEDYTSPIRTPYGWHIIKLLDKKSLEPFAELEKDIKGKVGKDSRSELNRSMLIQRLKKDNLFVSFPKSLDAALTLADSSIIYGAWAKSVDAANNNTLFSINNQKFNTNDFFKYITAQNRRSKDARNMTPSQYMKVLYRVYEEESLIAYEEEHLETKYEDYRMLVKEYRDGILLFQLMDEKVWSKAIEDTVGLKEFYTKNQKNYQWETRAHAKVYSLASDSLLPKLKSEIKKDKYQVTSIILANSFFKSSSAELDETAKKAADEVVAKLKTDKTYIVELKASLDSKEAQSKPSLQAQRIAAAKAYLISKGVDSSRIELVNSIVKQAKKAKVNELDRHVSYTLYSKSNKALEAIFNESAPLTLQITEGIFQKSDNDILKTLDWKVGEFNTVKDGRLYYTIISKIDAPRAKTFEEAKGLVISDYQTYLEKEWIQSLKKKYPVVVNTAEVEKLIKK